MKVSMKNWRQNRMKQFWLHTLLRTYSSVMMIIIASFAILLSYADWDSREKEAQRGAVTFPKHAGSSRGEPRALCFVWGGHSPVELLAQAMLGCDEHLIETGNDWVL